MFELTNAQRKCFGLLPVADNWTRIELKPSPYDQHATISYLDRTVLRKFIQTGDNIYTESEISEELSDDLQYLLPKTERGKPVLLSAATLEKRTGFGMGFSYVRHSGGYSYIDIFSHTSQKCYYSNDYEPLRSCGECELQQWVEKWCDETSQEDMEDVANFAVQPRQHVKFRGGDVFRFKINRRLYGYGRILLDYALMRKKKEQFWDVLAGKPLVCSVYHIASGRKDVSVEDLKHLKSLPSVHMMDNRLFYGDFEIIGNIPVGEAEDYPIMYGDSVNVRYRAVLLQCGKLYRRDENGTALFKDYSNKSIGFGLGFKLSVLLECIATDSNAPYWAQDSWAVHRDLRNPKFSPQLEQVCKQFDLTPSQLIK